VPGGRRAALGVSLRREACRSGPGSTAKGDEKAPGQRADLRLLLASSRQRSVRG
jgi:hypothetical protein